MRNFMKELSNYLENKEKIKSENMSIIEEILSKNKLTTGSKNAIIFNENDVILKYAKTIENYETIYFIKDNKKIYWANNKEYYDNNFYTVLKIENDKIERIEVSKNSIPKEIHVNDIYKIEKDKYVVDKVASNKLQEGIRKMAQEIIEKQNVNLATHRKEGHLYFVSEEIENNRFLYDLTDASNKEFEEVEMPDKLLEIATQGMVLKFVNGAYEYYSDNGFEMAENTRYFK